MLENLRFYLQLFAEGGDGGDGGSSSSVGEAVVGNESGDNKEEIPSSIPERARKYYQKAVEKSKKTESPKVDNAPAAEEHTNTTEERKSFADIVKSDEYKDEATKWVESTVNDRFKKYRGIEDTNKNLTALLDVVATKYGIDTKGENYLQELAEKINSDDSYYEEYAVAHDITPEMARKVLTMERKVNESEAMNRAYERQEQQRQDILRLQRNAEVTKQSFPQFDLDTAMQDEKFRKLCAITNGDTTAAYMACNWNQIIPAKVQMASQRIQEQMANAVASNKSRPIENGSSKASPTVVVEQDFSKMGLADIRKFAEEQRRRKSGR